MYVTGFALAAAAAVFALMPLGFLPPTYAVPVIGLVLAFGAAPDHVAGARPLGGGRRNWILAALIVAATALVLLRPQLLGQLVAAFGVEGSRFVVTVAAVIALALPLAMTESATPLEDQRDDRGRDRFVLTQRNLILALTVTLAVLSWYSGPGLSFLTIAAFAGFRAFQARSSHAWSEW